MTTATNETTEQAAANKQMAQHHDVLHTDINSTCTHVGSSTGSSVYFILPPSWFFSSSGAGFACVVYSAAPTLSTARKHVS